MIEVEGGDGGRGYPNVHVEVRDRDDKLVQTIPVVAANDWERLAPDGAPGSELEHHVAEVNHELARLHGQHDLVPLRALEVLQDVAIGDALHVEWMGNGVDVFYQPAADARPRRLARKHDDSWLAPKTARCANPAYLGGAYHADMIDLVVIDVRYRGTDLCWEPADQWHVVTY